MSCRPLARAAGVLILGAGLLAGCTPAAVTGHGAIGHGAITRPGSPASPAAPTTPPPPPQAAAHFRDCSRAFRLDALPFPAGRLAHLSVDCAVIAVPLSYTDPGGRTINLVFVRIHDDAAGGGRAPLLVNPGGPGGSGIEFAVGLAAKVSDRLLAHYDLVGFDPRGVGFSTPLHCVSASRRDQLEAASPDVRTASGFAEARRVAASLASACESKYGDALPYFNTVNTARDMDQIRQALGAKYTDYLGFSYGTELGSVYAHLFPSHVRRMVLDGAVDPLTSGIAQDTEQLAGFEQAFGQFTEWCRRHQPCAGLRFPARTVEKLARHAKRTPIPAKPAANFEGATPELVITGTFGPLYQRSQWPALAKALLAARDGNSEQLVGLADDYLRRSDPFYTNFWDSNTVINCNDAKPGPSDSAIRATARSWAQRFPVFGEWFAPSLFTCQPWQPKRTPLPKPTARNTRNPVLVVGNLHDPATPYQGAKDMTKVMGNARLLTWNGEGHTSYLQGSSCVDRYVNNYLISGALPPKNTVCPR